MENPTDFVDFCWGNALEKKSGLNFLRNELCQSNLERPWPPPALPKHPCRRLDVPCQHRHDIPGTASPSPLATRQWFSWQKPHDMLGFRRLFPIRFLELFGKTDPLVSCPQGSQTTAIAQPSFNGVGSPGAMSGYETIMQGEDS